MKWPIMMHINACEQGQTLDEACRKCSELGFDGIELRRKRSGADETPEEYLDAVASAVEKHKIKKVIFGSPGLQKLEGTDSEKEAELEEMIKFFELASKRFELFICNTFAGPLLDKSVPYSEYTKNGSFIARDEHWDYVIKSYKVLGELAQKIGFRFSFETHMCYLNDTMESTLRLVKAIDNPAVGINLDYGNLIYFENVPSIKDTVDAAGEWLYYVHFKNSAVLPGGGMLRTGLGEGDINNREFLKILKTVGYEGPICIEVPRSGDREWFVENDLYYLRKLVKEVEKAYKT